MSCPEWQRLFAASKRASQAFDDAVDATCGLDRPEFDEAMRRLESARDALQAAEKSIREHRVCHNCQTAPEAIRKASA